LNLVRFLCNQIEILVSKSDGIDKKLVVINVMKLVFSLNQQEIELIDHMVEFIWDNELIIKKSFTRFFDCFHSKKESTSERFRFCFNDKNKDFKARSCGNYCTASHKIHTSV
jgi:hypothetical protein